MKLLIVNNTPARTFMSAPYLFDLGVDTSLSVKVIDNVNQSLSRTVYYFFKDSVTAEAIETFLDSVTGFKATYVYEVRDAVQTDLDLINKARKFSAEYPIEGFLLSRQRQLPNFGSCEIKMSYTETTVTVDIESAVDNEQLREIINGWLAV